MYKTYKRTQVDNKYKNQKITTGNQKTNKIETARTEIDDDYQPYISSQPSYNNVSSNNSRYYGIIKCYFLDRGYGFIRRSDGKEFYFKGKDGFVLKTGMKVGFELMGLDDNQKAIRVACDGKYVG